MFRGIGWPPDKPCYPCMVSRNYQQGRTMGDAILEQPDKEWYTVQDVAMRLDWSEDDVLHYIQIDKLQPSFYLSDVNGGVRVLADETEIDEHAYTTRYSGLASLVVRSWSDLDKHLSVGEQWQGDLRDIDLRSGPPNPLGYDDPELLEVFVPYESTPIGIRELYVAHEELQRFMLAASNTMPLETLDPNGKSDATPAPAKESTRAVETLQKLLIAIVMDAYGYDPNSKDNTAVKDILSALNKVSVIISENTIRSHLKSGARHACLLKKD